MRHSPEEFTFHALDQAPQLLRLMREIEEIDFHDEVSKFNALIHHMFENAKSTNPSLNRVVVYTFFNCICKTTEARRGFMLLFKEGILSPAFSLTRTIFELWAAACYVEKAVREFQSTRNEERFSRTANKLFAGSRYPAELPWGEPSTERPVPISEMITELKGRNSEVEDAYGFLCEYCHPNFLYNMQAYLAARHRRLWENPVFMKSVTATLEKQLSCLSQALRGIKQCTGAISAICSEEYGLRHVEP